MRFQRGLFWRKEAGFPFFVSVLLENHLRNAHQQWESHSAPCSTSRRIIVSHLPLTTDNTCRGNPTPRGIFIMCACKSQHDNPTRGTYKVWNNSNKQICALMRKVSSRPRAMYGVSVPGARCPQKRTRTLHE